MLASAAAGADGWGVSGEAGVLVLGASEESGCDTAGGLSDGLAGWLAGESPGGPAGGLAGWPADGSGFTLDGADGLALSTAGAGDAGASGVGVGQSGGVTVGDAVGMPRPPNRER